MQLNVNLTSLAVVLWSGMLIIAGSIWVLSSQVRKLADLLEEQGKVASKVSRPASPAVAYATQHSPRKAVRRGSDRSRSRLRVG